MPEIPRIVLAPVQYERLPLLRVALRYAICLALTAMNAGVIAFAGAALYRATYGHPIELAAVTVLFAALLGSLVRVWSVAFRPPTR